MTLVAGNRITEDLNNGVTVRETAAEIIAAVIAVIRRVIRYLIIRFTRFAESALNKTVSEDFIGS